jgi:hypothetical protein
MYLRTIQRKNKYGPPVRYVQLAHNVWNPDKGYATAKVIHSFGREDELDRDALERLVRSIARYLGPEAELEVADQLDTDTGELSFVWSKPAGGALLLDGLWRRFGIDEALKGLLSGRRADERAERAIFTMVANRVLAGDDHKSKLACLEWAAGDVFLPGVGDLGADPNVCYRAMDLLLEVEAELAGRVFDNVANLLDLECDLLLFDTTSTYFEIDEEDGTGDDPGFRSRGHSKDHRPDLPQVVVGMAVTRSGIPIRVWCWPGETGDSPLIRQVKDDLRGWRLHRVVWVADRGFTSENNRRHLQRGGGSYILGEKLRGGSKEAQAALKRQGRYKTVRDNLRVKEVVVDDGVMRDRFVVCHNPEEAERDRSVRERIVARLEDAIAGSDELPTSKRTELYGQLSTRPTYKRFLRRTTTGKLRIDRTAINADAKLDGKFLLRTADPTLTAEDVALGYKQLPLIERGWRSMKQLDLRPIFHRLEDRIRAHIVLCWLALLLIRIAENATGDTWRNLRRDLQRLHVGCFTGSAGTVIRRTDLTARQASIFKAVEAKPPPQFLAIDTPDDHPVA